MHLNYKQISSGFSALEWRCHAATSSAHFQNRHLVEHLEHSFLFIEQFPMLKDLLAYQCIEFLNYRLNFTNEPNGSIIGHTWNLFSKHSLTYHMCFHRGPYGMDHIISYDNNLYVWSIYYKVHTIWSLLKGYTPTVGSSAKHCGF